MDAKLRKCRRAKNSKGEKEHRCRITKKIRELQALLPNSSKLDIASVLDEAIVYAKSLQCQVSKMMMESRPSAMASFGPIPELPCRLGHPQFAPGGLRINQGMCFGHRKQRMAFYPTVPPIPSSPAIVHSSPSWASTLPWTFHGVPSNLPVHVLQQQPHPPVDLQLGGSGSHALVPECSRSVDLHAVDQVQDNPMGDQ